MVPPEKRIVTAPAWLSYMDSELQKEIDHFMKVILEIRRQEQNPCRLAPEICAAYELAIQ